MTLQESSHWNISLKCRATLWIMELGLRCALQTVRTLGLRWATDARPPGVGPDFRYAVAYKQP
jgi:hypothetical protein